MTPTLTDRVVLESDDLVVAVVPEQGARVTSLRNRRDGREWLAPPRGNSDASASASRVFTETDHFGLDEMCPTVDPCRYPSAPYEGRDVPDHGELWCGLWEVRELTATSLTQRFESSDFGYTFERRLELREATLRFDYELEVTGPPTSLLWALHPQFSMRDGSRLLLGGERDAVLDTTSPLAPKDVAWTGDLVVERDVLDGEDRMLYLRREDRVEEATLVDVTGSWLRLGWDARFAHYLGIWMDRGRYRDGNVIAMEPTNGFYDDLARCVHQGTVTEFLTGDPVSWWVEISVGGVAS